MGMNAFLKKLDEDDLFSVAGGTGVGEIAAGSTSSRIHARSMSSGAAGSAAGAGAGAAAGSTLEGTRMTTAMLYCESCRRETLHRIFSGTRAVCSECSSWGQQ